MTAQNYRGLHRILVDKVQLIETVKENRDTHRAKFEEAMEGYRTKAIQILEDHIKRIKNNAPERVQVALPMPEDHTEDYDRVIAQLEWSLDESLELDEHEFTTYVMDQWGWAAAFAQTYSAYTE